MANQRTIGSGGDHSDINSWVSYMQGLGSLSADQEGLRNSTELNVGTTAQTISGVAENGHTITLKNAAGTGLHTSSANPIRYDGSKGAATYGSINGSGVIAANQNNLYLSGLQIKNTYQYGDGIKASGGHLYIDTCFVECSGSNSFHGIDMYSVGGNGYVKTTAVLTKGEGIKVNSAIIQACTLLLKSGGSGSSTGLISLYGSAVVKNNLVLGFGTASYGIGASSSNNACTNASFGGGSSNQVSATASTEIQGTSSGSEDLRIAAGSAKAKDNGTSSGVPSTDFFGVTRTGSYDIGCTEYVTATASTAFPRRDWPGRSTLLRM